ncbi:MAG: EFR1 family ferrodoxin [Dehalococcoidales bacterium]|nr:EFR1 family ferrodoxin [Dehalococcoidales bacterium]
MSDIKKVYAVYVSPTGTTERAVLAAAEGTGRPYEKIDLTTYQARQGFKRSFGPDELVIAGMPVYGGRLPMKLDDFFTGLMGNDAPAVALVMYGNREYEDALIEMKVKLEGRGLKVIAGAALVGEHTFSKNIATGRPNADDLQIAKTFGQKAVKGIDKALTGTLKVNGNYPYTAPGFNPAYPRYLTKHAVIITTENCTRCGLCAENCPWGAIEIDDEVSYDPLKCMRCFRCIKYCPSNAKKILDLKFYEYKKGFEERLNAQRKEPELFFSE